MIPLSLSTGSKSRPDPLVSPPALQRAGPATHRFTVDRQRRLLCEKFGDVSQVRFWPGRVYRDAGHARPIAE
jgi:hypothetical protein